MARSEPHTQSELVAWAKHDFPRTEHGARAISKQYNLVRVRDKQGSCWAGACVRALLDERPDLFDEASVTDVMEAFYMPDDESIDDGNPNDEG
jgi:hypothetical protein